LNRNGGNTNPSKPKLFVAISNNIIEQVTPLARTSKHVHNIASQTHRVSFDSLLKCLPIRKVRRKCSNKLSTSVSQVGVSEAGDYMLAAYVNNVREAHDSAVEGVKIDVSSCKKQ